MPQPIRLVLVLHNHQPVGNFDHVFEQAYRDSYRPFLEVFGRYEELKISLHVSGPLLEWLDAHHPNYLDRLAQLVSQGRIEIIGGAFYEPILAAIRSRDRVGQISEYSRWLQQRLGAEVRGMWVAERVWEQTFTKDLALAGIQYTVLDDFHFKVAGLSDEQLTGRYVTEDDGRLLSVFPGSERLRYTIPFADPQATIDYLASVAGQRENAVVVFADDGEKFGTWPETHKHVYRDRWLERFFDALLENRQWITVCTLGEAFDAVPPIGRIYLPDCSYREMTEWALPVAQQTELERIGHQMEHDPHWPVLRRLVRGGFWRNFCVRYRESNEMYSRMMAVSRQLEEAQTTGANEHLVKQARRALYRGQCNCAYWHGAFGGIYLPHLRNAVYANLIEADNLLEQAAGRTGPWVEAQQADFDFDAAAEARLANDKLVALLAPRSGGHLYELDVRHVRHNLLATMTRQPEAYHHKVLAGPTGQNGQVASIHDRVVFKQENLDQRIQYDAWPRKSLVDLFFDEHASLDAIAGGKAEQRGDFALGSYEARIQRKEGRVRLLMSRQGRVGDLVFRLTKAVTLNAGSSLLEVAYRLEQLPPEARLHFAVEWNFSGMPGGVDDRYFCDADGHRLGDLSARLDLAGVQSLGLADDWLGLAVRLDTSQPTNFWTFPVEAVSQSEGGFELVHQSVAVMPHWIAVPNAQGSWLVTMNLSVDTSLAENRRCATAMAATT